MKQRIRNKILRVFKCINVSVLISGILLGQLASGVVFEKTAFAEDAYWADRYVNNLVQRNIMKGDENGKLNAREYITRAEYVSMLNRSLGYTETIKAPFRDVKGTEWYANDISAAYNQGYFNGSGKSMANPNGYLTREEAVTMLCKALKVDGLPEETMAFLDSREFSSWSRDYINSSVDKKYVNGYEDNTFRSTNKITRGEVAKIISDSVGEIIGGPGMGSLGYIEGNATISSSGVYLENTVIQGDLYITEGVGLGYTNLKNVKVMGEIVISGAGESNEGRSSITLTDCEVNSVVINGDPDKTLTLKTDGNTIIRKTTVKTDAYLEEMTDGDGGFDTVNLEGPKKTKLNLSGSFSTINMLGEENELSLGKGSIETLNVEEEAYKSKIYLDEDTIVRRANIDTQVDIEGEGEIENIVINSSDVVVEGLPDNIEIRPGLTANINGKDMTSKEAEISSSSPKIISGYPDIEDLEATTATAIIKTNKPGTLYWAVTLKSEDSPTTDQLIKGPKEAISTGKITVKANEEKEIKLSGLKSNVKYVISAVMVDNKDDRTAKKTKTFTTVDNVVPTFVSGYPKITDLGSTSIDVAAIPSKDCTYYWGVFPAGSIAPTAKNIVDQKLTGEVSKGKTSSGKINVETIIKVSGLAEAKSYDLYLVAGSSDEEKIISDLKKLSFTTKDTIAPQFITGYPKVDKVTDNSVELNYNIDKDGTVYYVVCKRGAEFPVIIPKPTTPPSLDMQVFKDAVVTGNNSFKKGQSTAKANVEAKFTISGLEKETPYDLYIVAQDKFKNSSSVKKMDIKTADVYPPTAKLTFEEVIDGSPTVEGDIIITFNEMICTAFKEAVGSSVPAGTALEKVPPAELKNNLVLYDLTQPKRPAVDMDYSKIKVEEVDGKTIITLSSEVTKLKSGNGYEFVLNNIMDTSANKMANGTKLPSFTTVAPLVSLEQSTDVQDKFDIVFQMTPQAVQTADEILYDIVLSPDESIKFELYEKIGNGEFKQLNVVGDENEKIFEIKKDNPATIQGILYKNNYKFDKFNTFEEPKQYAITVVSIDGNMVRESWGKKVKVGVKCLIGKDLYLRDIASGVKENLDEMVNTQKVVLVHYPADFVAFKSFPDTITPTMAENFPQFEPGDTKIKVTVRANKPAKLYYLIVPKNTVGDEVDVDLTTGTTTKAAIEIDMKPGEAPTAEYIINQQHKLDGSFTGIHNITGIDTVTNFIVPDSVTAKNGKLVPGYEYDFYYVLVGDNGIKSEVERWRTKTTGIVAPKIISITPLGRDEKSVDVNVKVDSEAKVYWIVYPRGETYNESTGTMPSAKNIIDIAESEDPAIKPADWGITTTSKIGEDFIANVLVDGGTKALEPNRYYSFFATAQKDMGGDPSNVFPFWSIKTKDSSKPYISSINTVIKNTEDLVKSPYKGTISVIFSEPLYFADNGSTGIEPLVEAKFKEKYTSSLRKDAKYGVAITGTTGEKEEIGDRVAISTINFSFADTRDGDNIAFNYDVSDISGNLAGKLNIVFRSNGPNEKPEWVAAFDDGKDVPNEAPKANVLSEQPKQRSVIPEAQTSAPKTPVLQAPTQKSITFKTLPAVVSKGESFVDVSAKVDTNSVVYWAIYPSGSKMPTISEIKSGNKSVSSGNTSVSKDIQFTISCNGLSQGTNYSFYAFAEDAASDAISAVAGINSIMTNNAEVKSVSLSTTITDSKEGKVMKYSGRIAINFPSGLYFKADTGIKPLKPEAFKAYISRIGVSGQNVKNTKAGADGTISSAVIEFTSASDTARISFNYPICDKNGKITGKLSLFFNEDSLEWETEYGK